MSRNDISKLMPGATVIVLVRPTETAMGRFTAYRHARFVGTTRSGSRAIVEFDDGKGAGITRRAMLLQRVYDPVKFKIHGGMK